jgi:hypothetical protein
MAKPSAEKPLQIIEGHYLDPYRLVNLLQTVYGTSIDGEDKFRVEVRKFAISVGESFLKS